MKAVFNGVTIANSAQTIEVEGNHYFPPSSLREEYFEASDTTTVCGWKGQANYYSVVVNGERSKDAAWYYPEPKSAASAISGYVAFWRGVQVL